MKPEVKRDKYDKVQEYLNNHKDATMKEAFKATKVSAGSYYNQANRLTSSKRGKKSSSYEIMKLEPTYEPPSPQMVKPGMVGVVGAPEDIARMLAALAGGRA